MTATGSALPNMIGSDAVWSLLLASVSSPCAIPVSGGANRRRAAIATRTVRRDTGPITRRARPTGRPAPHSQTGNRIGPYPVRFPFAADTELELCPGGKKRKLREPVFSCSQGKFPRCTGFDAGIRSARRVRGLRHTRSHARPGRVCDYHYSEFSPVPPRSATMRCSLPTTRVQREPLLGFDPAPTIADGILDPLVHCAIRRGQDGS